MPSADKYIQSFSQSFLVQLVSLSAQNALVSRFDDVPIKHLTVYQCLEKYALNIIHLGMTHS